MDSLGDITNSGTHVSAGNISVVNGAAAEGDVIVQPGIGAEQNGAFQLNSYSGTVEWKLKKDASNYFRLSDVVNNLDRMVLFQNGQTQLNSGAGANAVVVNNVSGSGTGGLTVYEGGTNYSTAAWSVSGSGVTTQVGALTAPQGSFNGSLTARTHAGVGTMTLAAGSAAGTSATAVCATSHVCDGVSGAVTLTTGTGPATGTVATLTFPYAHSNDANCVVSVQSASGLVAGVGWSESTTALTLTANTALTASTAYSVRYWCGGN